MFWRPRSVNPRPRVELGRVQRVQELDRLFAPSQGVDADHRSAGSSGFLWAPSRITSARATRLPSRRCLTFSSRTVIGDLDQRVVVVHAASRTTVTTAATTTAAVSDAEKPGVSGRSPERARPLKRSARVQRLHDASVSCGPARARFDRPCRPRAILFPSRRRSRVGSSCLWFSP
jgi:hypothetical protein